MRDWRQFRNAAGARAACAAAGMGIGDDGWWPDVILAADCCYSDAMGDDLLSAIGHLLASGAPRGAPCLGSWAQWSRVAAGPCGGVTIRLLT